MADLPCIREIHVTTCNKCHVKPGMLVSLNRITFVPKRAVYYSASGERKLRKKREKGRGFEGRDPIICV